MLLILVIFSLNLKSLTHVKKVLNDHFPIEQIITKCKATPLNNIKGFDFKIDSLKLNSIDTISFKKYFNGLKLNWDDAVSLQFNKIYPEWLYCDYRDYDNSIVFSIINIDSWGWGYYFYYVIYDKKTKSLTSAIRSGGAIGDGDFSVSTLINWIDKNTFISSNSSMLHDGNNSNYQIIKYDSATFRFEFKNKYFNRITISNKSITDTISTN